MAQVQGSYAPRPLLDKCDRQARLAASRDSRLEASVPVQADSIRSRHPALYAKLRALHWQYPSWEAAFPEGIRHGLPYHDAIRQQLELRRTLGETFNLLKNELSFPDPSVKRFLDAASWHFPADPPPAYAGWSRQLDYDRIQELFTDTHGQVIERLSRLDYDNGFHSFCSRQSSAWGEIRAGLLVPNLIAMNINVHDLHEFSAHYPKLPQTVRWEKTAKKNIDLVWSTVEAGETVLHFGEVKTYEQVLLNDIRKPYKWQDVLARMEDLKSVTEPALVKVRLAVILVNGMSPKVYDDLKARGYEVLGPIVP